MKYPFLCFSIAILCLSSCNNTDKEGENKNMPPMPKDTIVMKSGYADVNGIKMYYEMHGDKGDVLVLIHGGGSTIGTSFGRIIPMLAKNNKVIAVELQAHGHTNDRDAPESFEQDADDVVELLKHFNIPKASFFGFSNGGNTAMKIAMRHPEIVNKLILASAFYKRDGLFPGFFDGMQQATINNMPQILKDAFLKINPDSSALLNMFNKDRNRMLNFKDWTDESLRSIKAPSLIITGDHDVATVEHTVAMSKLISGSRLLVLPATHGSYMGAAESPDPGTKMTEMLVGIVQEFLKKE